MTIANLAPHPASGGSARLGNQTRLLSAVYDIIEHRRLTPLFQPIIDMKSGRIIGHEGLIRGPSDSPLHSPPIFSSISAPR